VPIGYSFIVINNDNEVWI